MSDLYGLTFGDDAGPVWWLAADERARRLFGHVKAQPVDDISAVGESGVALFLNRAYLIEHALVQFLSNGPERVIVDNYGTPIAARLDREGASAFAANPASIPGGVKRLALDDLGPIYQAHLRKSDVTMAHRISGSPLRQIEWSLYKGAYKGVTDLFTKYAWPIPAFWLTRFAARFGLTPNFVTSISLALVLYAMYLFWTGEYGFGLLAAWGMCVLDTVDGKLARVTLNFSKWGEAYDHGIDLIHPPFWYWAWAVGLAGLAPELQSLDINLHLGIIIGGYVLGRAAEGLFMLVADGLEMWVWRPVDSAFRLIVARRNPNLALLTVGWAIGRPDLGLLWVSLWTIISLLYQTVRIVGAGWFRFSGRTIHSWIKS